MLFYLLPFIVPVLLIGFPLLCAARGRKAFRRAALISASVPVLYFLAVYIPGWILRFKAAQGDPAAMYDLARWTENHDGQIRPFFPWPVTSDVLGGYAWLEKSASLNHPPAVYAVGVRLKYGDHVPRPADWDGPEGNHFPQLERGQVLINQALRMGYQPTIEEKKFYWKQYRD